MTDKTGGAAFPSPGVVLHSGTREQQQGAYEGMTLRDYFAAKAMQGMIANGDWISRMTEKTKISPDICTAKAAFEVADAMLVERAK